MKNEINSLRLVSLIGLSMVLIGCISVSPSPSPRFYGLVSSLDKTTSQHIAIRQGIIVGINLVKIPQAQDRPQMVTIEMDHSLRFSQFNRWSQSLQYAIASLIREDLNSLVPQGIFKVYPWDSNPEVNYRVNVDITQLDSNLTGDMVLEVQWDVVNMQMTTSSVHHQMSFRQSIRPSTYAGLAVMLAKACDELSRKITDDLETLDLNKRSSASEKSAGVP